MTQLIYYLRMDAGKCAHRIDDDQVRLVVEVFRMLADPTRVRLLWTLVDGELSPCRCGIPAGG